MTIGWCEQLRPGVALKEIVAQATLSLIAMDADRLEELAMCCADLNCGTRQSDPDAATACALQEAAQELHLLDRVLYETRANLLILSRLRALRVREIKAMQKGFENHLSGDANLAGGEYGDN